MVGGNEVAHCPYFQNCIKTKTLWGCNFAIILKNYLSTLAKSSYLPSHLRLKLLPIKFYPLWNLLLVTPLTVKLTFIENIKSMKSQSFLNFLFTAISFILFKKIICVYLSLLEIRGSQETYGKYNNWFGFKLYPVQAQKQKSIILWTL